MGRGDSIAATMIRSLPAPFAAAFVLPAGLLLAGPLAAPLAAGTLHDPREIHLADVRQLTFGGDNAEAYWSFAGDKLTFQSTRPPFGCDQIFSLPVFPPGELQLVSSGKGRTTCSFFLPGDRRLLWAATDAYADACPHLGTPLAWRKDAYLIAMGDRIVCAAHGAQFEIHTGRCTLGPCLGDALAPVCLSIHESGEVHLADDNIHQYKETAS